MTIDSGDICPIFFWRFNISAAVRYLSTVVLSAKYNIHEICKLLHCCERDGLRQSNPLTRKLPHAESNADKLLEIRYIDAIGSYGVFAKEDIPEESVFTYAGKLRKTEDIPEDNHYFFSLDDTPFENWGVDAKDYGNYARYINHAPPDVSNLETEILFTTSLPTIAIVTSRDIKKGEQLLYDYGEEYWETIGFQPKVW